MRLVAIAFLVLAACGGGGADGAGADGGDGSPGQPDAGGGGGGDPDGCGPANCDGCCDGDSCRAGDSDDECGAGGAACQACGRWGECSEAVICELAADTRWHVVVESGTASEVNQGGTSWDGDGDLPDVYVRATAFDPTTDSFRSERTDAHEDLTPTWNQTLLTDLPGRALEGMRIELWDSDGNADDSFGDCVAAVRLEDAEAGGLELTCPRSLGLDGERAGWTVRLRLEPRSEGRPDAPALDRRAAAPLASEPGSCTIAWDFGDRSEVTSFDSWGRLARHEWRSDEGVLSSDVVECSGPDHCEEPGEAFSFFRLEPGPFGMRVRIHDNDVRLFDSLGRLVAHHDYGDLGSLFNKTLVRYAAKSRVSRYQSFDDTPSEGEPRTTDFDQHGSPLFIVEGGVTRELELDGDGLPIRYEVVKSDVPEIPIGDAQDVSYQGAGCAEVLAAEVTNGLVSR